MFEIPKITTPAELEVYTPEHKEQVLTTLNGLKGKVYDIYTVVPHYKGKYKIPEVTFSYFNPKEKKYKTITAPPTFVTVDEGKTLPLENNNSAAKQLVTANDTHFNFIALNTVFSPKNKPVFFQSNLFYILLFLPLLAIIIGIFIGKKHAERRGDVFGNKMRKADKLARKYLHQAKKQLGKKEAFYIALEKALHNFLKASLHIETSEISKEKIAALLHKRGVDSATVQEFITVLNDCDFARYTPTTQTMMQEEFEKAKTVIAKIDKKL